MYLDCHDCHVSDTKILKPYTTRRGDCLMHENMPTACLLQRGHNRDDIGCLFMHVIIIFELLSEP